MCRNILQLFNLDPPATNEEVEAAALQYVRKISGSRKPSSANTQAFEQAVAEVAAATRKLVDNLTTSAVARDREELAAKARERASQRYAAR